MLRIKKSYMRKLLDQYAVAYKGIRIGKRVTVCKGPYPATNRELWVTGETTSKVKTAIGFLSVKAFTLSGHKNSPQGIVAVPYPLQGNYQFVLWTVRKAKAQAGKEEANSIDNRMSRIEAKLNKIIGG